MESKEDENSKHDTGIDIPELPNEHEVMASANRSDVDSNFLSHYDEKTHTICEEYLFIFVCANAIFQLILDIMLESLRLIPTRINHLALTIVNAFASFKALSAIYQNKFRFYFLHFIVKYTLSTHKINPFV